ncbi:MAG: succinate dehydrogenase assembly factor 4 [Gammaproteobacteria bacterium]
MTAAPPTAQREIGGPPGPEPTRFGDWERRGRCIDF